MKIIKITPLILIVAFLVVAVPALAKKTSPLSPPGWQKKTQNQEKKQTKWQERCERIEAKINGKIAKFETNRGNHIWRYQRALTRLQRISSKLEARGQDTTTLNEKLATLETMIDEYAANYQNFIDELKGTKNYVCGESKGKFIKELNQARSEWREANTKKSAIKKFIWQDVRAEILKLYKAYRASLDKEETDTDNGEGENGEDGDDGEEDDEDEENGEEDDEDNDNEEEDEED